MGASEGNGLEMMSLLYRIGFLFLISSYSGSWVREIMLHILLFVILFVSVTPKRLIECLHQIPTQYCNCLGMKRKSKDIGR